MISKPIDAITADDLRSLISGGVLEGRTIEYKATLPGSQDKDKHEFLADASSFANAAGGDLLYGIGAKDGVPTEILGLADFNLDKDILRLESILRDSIEPRIPGLQFRTIEDPSAGSVLLIRIRKSWAGPHMVTFRGASRFHARSSAGKFQMDVTEIRSAFASSEDLPDRIRRWRDNRISMILGDETPTPLIPGARLVLHVVPLGSFSDPTRIAASDLKDRASRFRPIGGPAYDQRFNLDGYLTLGSQIDLKEKQAMRSYCQSFRSGRIEAVRAGFVMNEGGKGDVIPSQWYEEAILDAVASYLSGLEALDIGYPVLVLVALLNLKGVRMAMPDRMWFNDAEPIDRDVLLLPDVLILDPPRNLPRVLRPLFDAAWNASGVARSLNFDEQGKWRGRQLDGVAIEETE